MGELLDLFRPGHATVIVPRSKLVKFCLQIGMKFCSTLILTYRSYRAGRTTYSALDVALIGVFIVWFKVTRCHSIYSKFLLLRPPEIQKAPVFRFSFTRPKLFSPSFLRPWPLAYETTFLTVQIWPWMPILDSPKGDLNIGILRLKHLFQQKPNTNSNSCL